MSVVFENTYYFSDIFFSFLLVFNFDFTSQPLRDAIVEIRKRVVLSCEVSDADAPVQWLFNDEPLVLDNTCNITVEVLDNVRQLVIHNATNGHEGMYSCLTPDMRRTNCELFVQKPEVVFIEVLKDLEVYSGDTIEAKIRLSVSDAGGIWEWDNEHLQVRV